MKSVILDTPDQKRLKISVDNQRQGAHHTWFRGEHCNFNPQLSNLIETDSVLKHVLQGWAPETPLIGHDTKVVAFGSCFAENITKWLSQRNYSVLTNKEGDASNAYIVRFGEGMVNSFVIRQQFEWAFENKVMEEELWHGYDAEAFGYSESVKEATKSLFMQCDVFVITLGLSEIWYDEVTGGVFWRAVPAEQYDASRHKFRVSSVQENKDNISAIYNLIRKYRPEAKVIFTLSPIPLVATFRPDSCITANSTSKAILRAALDEVIREIDEPEFLYYWPSYEIVVDVFEQKWKADRRHVKEPILDFIMTLFEVVWCHGAPPAMPLSEAWVRAKSASGAFPRTLPKALTEDDPETVDQLYRHFLRIKRRDIASVLLEAVQDIAKIKPNSSLSRWAATIDVS